MFILSPVFLHAGGLGFSAAYGTIFEDSNNHGHDDNVRGVALVYDTNLGAHNVFSYRLGFEFMEVEQRDDAASSSIAYAKRVNLVNTFGFGIFRSEHVRVWVGPRLLLTDRYYKINESDGTTESYDGIDVGIAPALGVNINLNSHFSIALDADYTKILFTSGDAFTGRAYLFFRFGE
jgi:hypothetical protein